MLCFVARYCKYKFSRGFVHINIPCRAGGPVGVRVARAALGHVEGGRVPLLGSVGIGPVPIVRQTSIGLKNRNHLPQKDNPPFWSMPLSLEWAFFILSLPPQIRSCSVPTWAGTLRDLKRIGRVAQLDRAPAF